MATERRTKRSSNPRVEAVIAAFEKELSGEASASLVIPENPVPASRPRVTRWGTYYSKTYKNWMKAAEKALAGFRSVYKFDGPVAVLVVNVVARPKTSERDYPRGDTDNYAKASLDAITKNATLWNDDDQVVVLLVTKRFAASADEVGSHITVWSITQPGDEA